MVIFVLFRSTHPPLPPGSSHMQSPVCRAAPCIWLLPGGSGGWVDRESTKMTKNAGVPNHRAETMWRAARRACPRDGPPAFRGGIFCPPAISDVLIFGLFYYLYPTAGTDMRRQCPYNPLKRKEVTCCLALCLCCVRRRTVGIYWRFIGYSNSANERVCRWHKFIAGAYFFVTER